MHQSSSSQSPYPDHVPTPNNLPLHRWIHLPPSTPLHFICHVYYKWPSQPTQRMVLTLLAHLSLFCSVCSHTIPLPLQRANAFLLYLLRQRMARAVWIRSWGVSSIGMPCRINTQISSGFSGVQHWVMNLLYLLYPTSLPLPLARAPTSILAQECFCVSFPP